MFSWWVPQLICRASGSLEAQQCWIQERQKWSPVLLQNTLSPGWTGRVWKAVKFGVCWHLRFPFTVFWVFCTLWGFMHKDACYWIQWIDTWLQGFSSDRIPVTSNFQVWQLLWYLYSGLAYLVRHCITQTREPNRVFGEDGFSLRGDCRWERAARLLLLRESKEPTKSASTVLGCGIACAFQFFSCLYYDQSGSLPARKLWKCVMKSVCKLSLSLKGIRNINETKKLTFEVASCSSSNTCKGSVKLCERTIFV